MSNAADNWDKDIEVSGTQCNTRLLSLADLVPPKSNLTLATEEIKDSSENNIRLKTPSGNTVFNPLTEIKQIFSPKSNLYKHDERVLTGPDCSQLFNSATKPRSLTREAEHSAKKIVNRIPHFVTPQQPQRKTITDANADPAIKPLDQRQKVAKSKSKQKTPIGQEGGKSFDLYNYLQQQSSKMPKKRRYTS